MEEKESNTLVMDGTECKLDEPRLWSVDEDTKETNKIAERMRRLRMYTIYFTSSLQYIATTFTTTSLWPYLKKINPHTQESFLAITFSIYDLACLLASFAFGYWSNKHPPIGSFVLSSVLFVTGNLLYSFAQSIGSNGIWMVFVGRLFLGASLGITAVCRALIANMSSPDDVTQTMSRFEMFNYLGAWSGVIIQMLMSVLGMNGFILGAIHFDMFTAPSFLLLLLNICSLFLLLQFVYEDDNDINETGNQTFVQYESVSYDPVDKYGVCVMLLMYAYTMLPFSSGVTLASPILMEVIGWDQAKTVLYGGIILSTTQSLGIITFIVIKPLSQILKDRSLMLIAMLLYLVCGMLLFPWGPGRIKLTNVHDVRFLNGSTIQNGGGSNGGCPEQYDWCHTTPAMPLPQLIVSFITYSIASSLGTAMSAIIYAKIIGPYNHGIYMGWFTCIGAFSRILDPLLIISIYVRVGIRPLSVFVTGVSIVVTAIFLVARKRIVPLCDRPVSYHTLR